MSIDGRGSVADFRLAVASRNIGCDGLTGCRGMIEFKGSHFEREVILRGMRWYVAYPISYRGNDAGARRGGRSLNTQSLGSEVCPAPGRAIPGAETSGRVQLANGRDLCSDQGRLEVSVSRGRQGRRNGGLPVDGQTRSQGGAAFLTQGDRTEWHAREDHDRQERCQHGGNRKL